MGHHYIGAPVEDLPTPALLLDLQTAIRNVDRMADYFADRPAKLRPHFKNHKCTRLMLLQVARSAVGVTCAKLGEAEVLVEAGFDDILIANQVVGAGKIRRLIDLLERARVRVAVDCVDNCRELAQAAERAGQILGCLVEVDIGMGRCGVAPGKEAVDLAAEIVHLPGLSLDGVQAYEGHLVTRPDPRERRDLVTAAMAQAVETLELMRERLGVPAPILSGGGTGTYDITGTIPGVAEVQAGTYVTMDNYYRQVRPEFGVALTILSTCISAPTADRAVLDVGVKGAGAEFGPPVVAHRSDVEVPTFRSEEHCILKVAGDPIKVGDKVSLIPSHACTTCNLHRELIIHEGGRVLDVWPIEGSGRLQ